MIKQKKEELEKLTVKELRVKLVKLGMSEEDAELFETKKPLIATINTLATNTLVASASTGELKRDKAKYLSKKETMRAQLMAQPRIRILIPIQGSEKPGVVKWIYNKITKRKEQHLIRGAYTPVQLNGFKWIIPHGVYEEVPEQIANIISEAQEATNKAGSEFLLDRTDPKTGQSIRDAME